MSKKKTIFVCALASLLALFTACELIQSKPEPSSEKASVRVLINADNLPERTVRPEVALNDVSSWELWGTNNGNTETNYRASLKAGFARQDKSMYYIELK
jgi:hypothetical protein